MLPTQRFSDRATDYANGRPSYPPGAIDALFAGVADISGCEVVDLGAGTGIGARLLAERGAHVTAVEPNAEMRTRATPHAGVTWYTGTAEATGLLGASADLVTAFQAFHWFDAPAALEEIVRLLRPGGRAATIYNDRDPSDPFSEGYGALIRRFRIDGTDKIARHNLDNREAFAKFSGWRDVREIRLLNATRLDRARLQSRAASTSYLPLVGPEADAMRTAIDALYDAHAVDGFVEMSMHTRVIVAYL